MRGICPERARPVTLTSVLSLKGEEAGNSDLASSTKALTLPDRVARFDIASADVAGGH
jgi:hypothetical protein